MQTREHIEEEMKQAEIRILDLKNYLASKDYQTIREMQGGEPMSKETKKQCAKARAEINELEAVLQSDASALAEFDEHDPIV